MSNKKSPLNKLYNMIPLQTPYMLYIDPCGACNLKCSFCPCNTESYKAKERHKIMDMNLFKKILCDLDLFEEQVDIAYLYGFGEPLLNPYFCDMVSLLNEKVGKVRTVTNGTLLNKELNTQLAESGIDYIRISVEALSSEGYMSVSGANIDFNKFVENIYDLYDKTRGKTEIGIRIISEGLRDQSEAKKFYDIFKPFSDYASIDNVRAIWPGCEPKKASALRGGVL